MRTAKDKEMDEAADLIEELMRQNDALRKRNAGLERFIAERRYLVGRTEELQTCPICGASPWIYEDIQDHHIVCSEDCPAPRCEHTYPRDTSMSWNDWVRWYRTLPDTPGCNEAKRLIASEPLCDC